MSAGTSEGSFSTEVEAGLEEIGDLSPNTVPAGRSVSRANCARQPLPLADHPEAYPLIPRYEAYGHRRKPYRAYLIIYTVEADHVLVDAILHGGQDYETM